MNEWKDLLRRMKLPEDVVVTWGAGELGFTLTRWSHAPFMAYGAEGLGPREAFREQDLIIAIRRWLDRPPIEFKDAGEGI